MRPTKASNLLAGGAIGLMVGAAGSWVLESWGSPAPEVPWPAIVGMLLLGGTLLVLGIPIKRWNDGERKQPIDPLQAARVAMMAKACSLTGAALSGWYLGSGIYILLSAGFLRTGSAMAMFGTFVVAAALMTVGIVVERFCQLPPDDPSGAAA
ncbi:MFS transporter [Brevibacterium sp. HMSC08F02]|uniref:DUF3180 domain-containing protein n=1 Tax=Brevibacterium TaxID=1696 RepID=UPI00030278DD|nr:MULTISPECIES: DUF3180 domain-containing protein [Brevibacterium]OFT25085.1 MFS transporter [Brevibacterium sp. HMSC08F02]